MKWKQHLYTALAVIGLCIVGAVFFLRNSGISSREITALMGIASGIICVSVSRLLALRMEKTDPALRKRNRIEQSDERNTAIRRRAKALSGDALLWAMVAAAWISFIMGAPAWLLLLAAAALAGKYLLELCLIVRFQDEM